MSIEFAQPEAVPLGLGATQREVVGEALAKRWLIKTIANRPLTQLGGLDPLKFGQSAARFALTFLEAVEREERVAALLERAADPSGGLPALAASRDPERLLEAAEALRQAAWEELSAQAGKGKLAATPALLNRVSYLCVVVAQAALGSPAQQSEQPRPAPARPAADLEWDFPASPPASEEPAQWRKGAFALGRALGGAPPAEGESPFTVLLLELEGIERLGSSESEEVLGSLLERVGAIMAAELRPDDRIAQEGSGRWWLVAPHTDLAGARALGERLAAAVRGAVSHRGVPLRLTVGLAEGSGEEAPEELARAAERSLFAARAAGVTVTPS